MRLFVYGSLLSGEDNHCYLAGSPKVGDGQTAAGYVLVDLGAYPALLEGGTTSVRGEVYEVDAETLASVDAFEGHPLLYRRVPVRLSTGEQVAGYLLQQRELATGRAVIADGDWKRRTRDVAIEAIEAMDHVGEPA
jgi:gamma-glutamylaminecyclotransferase